MRIADIIHRIREMDNDSPKAAAIDADAYMEILRISTGHEAIAATNAQDAMISAMQMERMSRESLLMNTDSHDMVWNIDQSCEASVNFRGEESSRSVHFEREKPSSQIQQDYRGEDERDSDSAP